MKRFIKDLDKKDKILVYLIAFFTCLLITTVYILNNLPKVTVKLSDIVSEKPLPNSLDTTIYNHQDFVVTNVVMKKELTNETLYGFYYYEDSEQVGKIFLNDLSGKKAKSTFLHEYSHHIMEKNMDNLPYLKELSDREFETDVLAYQLSLKKNVYFKSSYSFKPILKYNYNKNKELKKDINYLIDFEMNN